MIVNKAEFVKRFLPETVNDFKYIQIDLDQIELPISDILRNINTQMPPNSRLRNSIISGTYAIIVSCKSELLHPLSGLIIVITNESEELNVVSQNYIVLGIPETRIIDEFKLEELMDTIYSYLIKEFRDVLADFNSYFCKYVYAPEFDDPDTIISN